VLLETSENIKDRYRTQAQSIAAPMLLQGLELFSKCDISYKAAKNQRLLVELTLMQACSLDDQGEKKNLS
jgi:DNA polymerase-3 subunit gamma/tau